MRIPAGLDTARLKESAGQALSHEIDDTVKEADLFAMEKSSYSAAGKYGKKASDYLAGVRSMCRVGYQNTEDFAEKRDSEKVYRNYMAR